MAHNAKTVLSKLFRSGRLPRIIYNDDTCTLRTAPPPHTLDSLSYALDYLKGTQVDCLCWCVGEQIAYAYPSKVMENFYDLHAKGANLAAGWQIGRDVMHSLYRQGIEYLPPLIERAHKQGLTFIASFRMNDTHIKSYPSSVLTPEFWKQHQDLRIWEATDAKGYYNAALDYSHAIVRNRYRDAIVEVAEKYDVDGIELDFTRSPYFFQPSEAWKKRATLTRFVRDIRDRLEKIGTRRKRPFALVLRIASPDRALVTAGIDAKQWIKEQLPTVLVISELANNFNQSLEPWRTLCRKAGVLLYPAVEATDAYNRVEFYSTHAQNPIGPRHDGSAVGTTREDELDMQRAAAQNHLAQEPDGIYMFNFPCRIAEGRNVMHTDPKVFTRTTSVLREMGSLKTLARKPKHYTYYKDLPLYVEANRPRRFHQTIEFAVRGKDIRSAQVALRYRQVVEKNPHSDGNYRRSPVVKPGMMKVYLNDREIPEADLHKTRQPAGRVRSGFKLKSHELVELRLPGRRLSDGINTLAFEMSKFPHERDPYIYIYDLEIDLTFDKR
jgi:hypothetical protein